MLVTGARGFVGRHLLARLAIDLPAADVRALAADLTDAAAVAAEVRAFAPDACLHLAAVSAVSAASHNPGRAWQVNLHGTLHLARAIMAETPDCLLVFASSADCYGGSFRSGVALTEAAVLAPLSTYAATKAAADLALGAMVADGLRCVRARPANHTGPGQSEEFVIAAFARQIARVRAGLQPPVLRVGALEHRRDFLDVRDVCRAYVACLRRADDIPAGAIINVASGHPRRIGDILERLMASAGVTARIETDPARLRHGEIAVAATDATSGRELLGWSPAVAWDVTIADVMADWFRRAATPHPG